MLYLIITATSPSYYRRNLKYFFLEVIWKMLIAYKSSPVQIESLPAEIVRIFANALDERVDSVCEEYFIANYLRLAVNTWLMNTTSP